MHWPPCCSSTGLRPCIYTSFLLGHSCPEDCVAHMLGSHAHLRAIRIHLAPLKPFSCCARPPSQTPHAPSLPLHVLSHDMCQPRGHTVQVFSSCPSFTATWAPWGWDLVSFVHRHMDLCWAHSRSSKTICPGPEPQSLNSRMREIIVTFRGL